MQKQQPIQTDRDTTSSQPVPVVNEPGSINLSGYVRVFDPKTQEILVEARE